MQPKSKLSTTTAELSSLDGGRSRPPLLFSKLDRVGQARRKKQREWILPSCKGCGGAEGKNWRPGRKAKGCAAKEREVWDGTGVGTPQPHGEDGVRG